MKTRILLIVIFTLALALRLVGLGSNPPALNWDEVSHGYNAFSILKTGSDEWGQFLPIANFRAYGDYPLPLYMYLTIPGLLIFGLSEFAIRLPSAIFGSLLVLAAYFLAKTVFRNDKLSNLAALLVAISPWSILTSRQVLQATPAIFFLSLGIGLFLSGLGKKKWAVYLGVISLGLSAYAYHNTRILTPLIFILLVVIYSKVLFKKYLLVLVIAGAFFLPLIPITLSSEGSAREIWVGILDQGAINYLNQSRGNATMAKILTQVVFNRPVYFAEHALLNYLSYFSPNYLGFEGGTQYQYSIPHFGLIFPVELPFFYFGLLILLVNFKKISRAQKLLLIVFLLTPIPASVTRDPYQVARSTTMMPYIFIVSSFGFIKFLEFFSNNTLLKRIFLGVFFGLTLVLLASYLYNFNFVYRKDYSFAWQYGYKQAVSYIEENKNKYSSIVMTKKYGEPHEFVLFYSQYDPNKYKTNPNLVRYIQSNWFWVDGFDKYQFINDWEIKSKLAKKTNILLITSPGNYPANGQLLQRINFLDGIPAFDIIKL